MPRHLFILLIAIPIFFSCEQKECLNTGQILGQLDSLITAENDSNFFSGTIVIGNNDSILFSKTIGIANRDWDISLKPNHRFDICSLNKSFIAALVLLAVEEGRLNLDDFLVDQFDANIYKGRFHEEITIHQMLTHTSGLPNYDAIAAELRENEFQSFKGLHFSNDEYVNFISQLKPVNQPNQEFHYSNFAYHLLCIILENIYQISFSELLKIKICEPLGLEHTFNTKSNKNVNSELVEAYNYDMKTNSWIPNQFIDLSLGRRIFSTSLDLFKWGQAMNDNSILNEKSISLMQENHLTKISSSISYGYAWVVFDGIESFKMGNLTIDKKYILHGGSTEGFKSMLVNIEKGEFIIAFLSNSGNKTEELGLTKKIVNILIQ